MAMFPGLKEAFARLSREDFGGTAIQTTTTVDAVKSAEQMKEQQSVSAQQRRTHSRTAEPGVDRRRDRRLHAPAAAATAEGPAPPDANPARSTFMTMNNEVLKIASNVTAADVAMPAGFKERTRSSV